MKATDDDQDEFPAQTTRIKAGPTKPSRHQLLSEYQSCATHKRPGIFIATWILALTKCDAEQKLIAFLDYWLGIGKKKTLRASPERVHFDAAPGGPWLIQTAREIGRQIGKDKRQVHRIIERLRKKNLLSAAPWSSEGQTFAYVLRLRWDSIEQILNTAGDGGTLGGDESEESEF